MSGCFGSLLSESGYDSKLARTYARELLESFIAYSLVTLRVEWLGIFGKICLPLQHHGLGLGSTLVPLLFYPSCHLICYYLGSLLVWRIGIWGDRFGTVFGGLQQFGDLSGGLRKPMVVIMPKSMDRFMERPPMKIVQP
jgi:hypothetical protein